MSFNAGAQISDTSSKIFVEILPKLPLFLLFKAVVSLSISLTSTYQIIRKTLKPTKKDFL